MNDPAAHPVPDWRSVYRDARPYTRWWWFSGPIDLPAVRSQLAWLSANGFGGVEIAWVYPQPESPDGPRWLSPEWSAAVSDAAAAAAERGLGCDFTFGTLWPFGGTFVEEEDASRTFRGPSAQRLGRSWEERHARGGGRILSHLDAAALRRYAARMGSALAPALARRPAALFCDSWEVDTDGLWADGLDVAFRERFGYDIVPYLETLDGRPAERYDYRRVVADAVLDGFYRPFTDVCHEWGALSRVQCHGAPTDLVAAYAAVDVPESEAVLFDPPFARIAASAAAIRGRTLVSAEAFTCLYGWVPYPGPGPGQGVEDPRDLKLCADALFASGVNLLVWHGTPYQTADAPHRFYATVHVGPDAAFADDLPELNAYFTRISEAMRRGRPFADVAVLLPLDDAWMLGKLPAESRRPSGRHHWEMHGARVPRASEAYGALWVTEPFLASAESDGRSLVVGEAAFRALSVDANWLSAETLHHLLRLAGTGLPVCLSRAPRRPGRGLGATYDRDVARLLALPNVRPTLAELGLEPQLLSGPDAPPSWCRAHADGRTVFVAHPEARGVTYPMPRVARDRAVDRPPEVVDAIWRGRVGTGLDADLELSFAPGDAFLVHVDRKGRPTVERARTHEDKR